MKSKLVLVSLFSFFAVFLFYTRFANLSRLPPSLFSDEVDAQYQAFLFNRQKSDYFGNLFPVHFHSFADWRTPAAIYTAAIIQSLTPQFTDISIRLTSAVFGIGFILVMSAFIFKAVSPPSGLVAFVFLAFSPWLTHFSRVGFEVTGMLFCLSLNLLLLYQFVQKKQFRLLCLSAVFLILSTYFYSTAKLFAIFIFILEALFWWPDIVKIGRKNAAKLLLICFIITLPLLRDTILQRTGFRFSYISIFSNPQIAKDIDYLRYQDILIEHQGEIGVSPPLSSKALHNRFQYLWQNFYRNYVSSFSTDFLLLKGDLNLRQGFSHMGPIYPLDLILLFIGLFFSFRTTPKRSAWFFLTLFLLAPVPFSLTRDSLGPHATRLILFLIPLTFFISHIGLIVRKTTLTLLLAVYLFLFIDFWHYYSLHYPQISARYWHSGIKETIVQSGLYPNTDIYFSNQPEPILPFFLFYSRYLPPQDTSLIQNLKAFSDDFFDGSRLGQHYYFGHLNWSSPPSSGLIITTTEETKNNPDFAKNFKTILVFDKKYIEQPTYLLAKPINEN